MGVKRIDRQDAKSYISGMKTYLKLFLALAVPAAVFILVVSISGCKVESANKAITITPQSAALLKGESVTLVADGGYDITWSLENESWGTLRPRVGHKVTYTSNYRPTEYHAEVQVVKLESRLWGSGGTAGANESGTVTNGSPIHVERAEAYISHLRHPM